MKYIEYKASNFCLCCSLLGLLVVSGCSSTNRLIHESDPGQELIAKKIPQQDQGARIANIAARYEGVNYLYGGSDPSGFDCSGLVYYVHKQAGVSLPRTAREQYATVRDNSERQPKNGDVAFFSGSNGVSHVGIMVDEERFIHAPKSGGEVEYRSLAEPYWRNRLVLVAPLYHD